jgi:hypothetical protein
MTPAIPLSRRLSIAWRALTVPTIPRRPRETNAQFINRSLADFFREDAVTGIAASSDWSQQSDRDKTLSARREDLSSALAAWRTNPLARRIVTLTRDHVWGKGLRPISKNKTIQRWLDRFWDHDLNLMDERWPAWIDALTTDGEVFPTFFQSEADGMTICRALPAAQIDDIKWHTEDYEQITTFGQHLDNEIELKWWPSILFATPDQPSMWQYAINRPVGVIRGDGDLTPALPWLAYYSDWLESRVKRNAILTKFYYDIAVENSADVDDAKTRYAHPPADGTAVVHAASEKHSVIQPQINADDAEADGLAIRKMIAVGGNIPLHWLAEAEGGSSQATSSNMNDVSYRHYETRQAFIKRRIQHLCAFAYRRAADAGAVRRFADLQLSISASDISREDNQKLAQSARELTSAFAEMIGQGLDTDRRLVRLIYRFAGEDLDEDEIAEIVTRAERHTPSVTSPTVTRPAAALPGDSQEQP